MLPSEQKKSQVQQLVRLQRSHNLPVSERYEFSTEPFRVAKQVGYGITGYQGIYKRQPQQQQT